jgi:hypothetical protein
VGGVVGPPLTRTAEPDPIDGGVSPCGAGAGPLTLTAVGGVPGLTAVPSAGHVCGTDGPLTLIAVPDDGEGGVSPWGAVAGPLTLIALPDEIDGGESRGEELAKAGPASHRPPARAAPASDTPAMTSRRR